VKKREIEQASHAFKDPGEPIDQADYQPITVQKDPEQSLALIFARLGRDYGGPLPAAGMMMFSEMK
jgi:hypothetical protein